MPIKPGTHKPAGKAPARQSKRRDEPILYNLRKWRRMRLEHIVRNPLCVKCAEAGKIQPGEEVDHIQPHHNDHELMFDPDNLQTLCKACHSEKTFTENGGLTRAAILPRWLERPDKPLIVVCGPPAAGKTTWTRESAGPGDLILDQDDIALELTGAPLWSLTAAQRDRILRERNKRLADFCAGRTSHACCYLIATAGTFKQRKFWTDMGAALMVIHPGVDVCLQRLADETRRPEKIKPDLAKVVRAWR